jgi:glutamyl-tRNA synthetase
MNGMYLRRLPDDRLADLIVPFLEKAGLVPDRAVLMAILPHIRERLQTSLLDAVPLVEFLFIDPLPIGGDLFKDVGLPPEQVVTLLGDTHARWASVPFTAADLERELRAVIEERGFNRKHSMMTVRLAATGRKATPPLFESLAVLGRGRTLERLVRARDAAG